MAEVDLHDLLLKYKTHPYELVRIQTPHTGRVQIKVEGDMAISGPKVRSLTRL